MPLNVAETIVSNHVAITFCYCLKQLLKSLLVDQADIYETSTEQEFIRIAQSLHDDLSSFCAAHACTGSCYNVQQKTRTEYVHNTSCTSSLLFLSSGKS